MSHYKLKSEPTPNLMSCFTDSFQLMYFKLVEEDLFSNPSWLMIRTHQK